jgi:hypothetical protein
VLSGRRIEAGWCNNEITLPENSNAIGDFNIAGTVSVYKQKNPSIIVQNGDCARQQYSLRHDYFAQLPPSNFSIGYEGQQFVGPAHRDTYFGLRPLFPHPFYYAAISGRVSGAIYRAWMPAGLFALFIAAGALTQCRPMQRDYA